MDVRGSWVGAYLACLERTALLCGMATQAMQLAELASAGDRVGLRSFASHGRFSLRRLPRERQGDADELLNRGFGFPELADRRVDVVAKRVRKRAQEVCCHSSFRVQYVGQAHLVLEPSGVLADGFS